MESDRFAVFEFEDGVSLAAEKWITPRKTHCYWPPYKKQSRIFKAVENQENCTTDWPLVDIIKILTMTKTFKRGQTKCSEALVMSDINTDSEFDSVIGSKKLTKSSRIVRPFPLIDFDDAACSFSSNGDLGIEMIKRKSTSKVQMNVIHETHNDEIKTVLVALAKLDLKIDALAAEVRSILLTLAAKTTDEEIDKTESQILKAFPLIKEDDLAEVEQRLSTDANYKNTMIKDLAIFVQSDVKTTVSKLMHEIMSNVLAANYSFHGAHKKKAFEKLKLCDVVSSVIRCRVTKPLVVNKEISDPIKSWLRHAPGRLAREEKKSEATNAVNNPETVIDRDDGPNNNRINNNENQQVNRTVLNNNEVENSVTVEILTSTSAIKDSIATSTVK